MHRWIFYILFIFSFISCRSSRSLLDHTDIKWKQLDQVVLPPVSGSVHYWLIKDSIFIMCGNSGVYYCKEDRINEWKKISPQVLKSADIFDFKLYDGRTIPLLAGLSITNNLILFFHFDLTNDTLIPISAGDIPSGVDQTVALTAYSYDTLRFIFVSGFRGLIEQWQVYDPGWGQADGKVIRQFSSPMFNKYLIQKNNFLYGAFPDNGWWNLDLSNGNEVIWDKTKNKSFKENQLHLFTPVVIKGKLMVLVLFKDGQLIGFDPLTAKRSLSSRLPPGMDTGEIKLMISKEDEHLQLIRYIEGRWIIQTYLCE